MTGSARAPRVEPAAPHLARQVALQGLGDRVAAGLEPEAAVAAIAEIEAAPGPWSPGWSVVAYAAVGAAAVALLGGSGTDAVLGALLSLLVAAVARVRHPLTPFLAALLVGASARVASVLGADPTRLALGALVALTPGMALTVAAAETAAGHLTAGTGRFAGAVVTLVQLAAGLAIAQAMPAPAARFVAVSLPWATGLALIALAPVAIGILNRLRPVDVPVAVAVAAATALVAGPTPLAAGVAAFVATVLANALGARFRVPPAVYSAPALTLLVPGTMGVRGVGELIAGGSGAATGLEAALSRRLAAGMLVGQGVVVRSWRRPGRPSPRPQPAS